MRTVRSGALRASYSQHAPKRIRGPSLRLPNYQQQDSHSCGFLAALTVARYFDPEVCDRRALSAIAPSFNTGTTQHRMMRGLGALGVLTQYRDDLTIGKLYTCVLMDLPVIVSVWPEDWDGDHWVVVQGFRADMRVYLTNHPSLCPELFWEQWVTNWGDGAESGAGLICTRRLTDRVCD